MRPRKLAGLSTLRRYQRLELLCFASGRMAPFIRRAADWKRPKVNWVNVPILGLDGTNGPILL